MRRPTFLDIELTNAEDYLEILRNIGRMYRSDERSQLAGLSQFDNEWLQIRNAQQWAAKQGHNGHTIAKKFCVDFPLVAWSVLELRVDVVERIDWLSAAWRSVPRSNLADKGRILGNLGHCYTDVGNLKKAEQCYQRRFEIAEKLADQNAVCLALQHLAGSALRLGNTSSAIQRYAKALKTAQQIPNVVEKTRILGNLGLALERSGQKRAALKHYLRRIELLRVNVNLNLLRSTLQKLAAISSDLGNKSGANAYLKQAMSVARRMRDRASLAGLWATRGNIEMDNGAYSAALSAFKHAKRIYRKIPDSSNETKIYGSLGFAYWKLKRLKIARRLLSKSIEFDRKWKRPWDESTDLGNLGGVLAEMGEHDLAMSVYAERIALARRLKDNMGAANSLLALAALHRKQRRFGNAFSLARRAVRFAQKTDNHRFRRRATHFLNRMVQDSSRS